MIAMYFSILSLLALFNTALHAAAVLYLAIAIVIVWSPIEVHSSVLTYLGSPCLIGSRTVHGCA